jgi:predicted house-cleaning noncanonical NTP pyrophosphatase (MazG superfamily)
MKRVSYNKLIRDRVKERIEAEGDVCEVTVLRDDEEFKSALLRKLVEEVTELSETKGREEFLSEYADLMVVLDSLTNLYELSEADVKLALVENLEKKGAFKERHFLHWSEYKGKQ